MNNAVISTEDIAVCIDNSINKRPKMEWTLYLNLSAQALNLNFSYIISRLKLNFSSYQLSNDNFSSLIIFQLRSIEVIPDRACSFRLTKDRVTFPFSSLVQLTPLTFISTDFTLPSSFPFSILTAVWVLRTHHQLSFSIIFTWQLR